jgi:hypothetical protein
MMLARVADSLYWIGRYVERAEHMCRLADVLLNATLDRTESSGQVARMVISAVSDGEHPEEVSPWDAALAFHAILFSWLVLSYPFHPTLDLTSFSLFLLAFFASVLVLWFEIPIQRQQQEQVLIA